MLYVRKYTCPQCKTKGEIVTSQRYGKVFYTCTSCQPVGIMVSSGPSWIDAQKTIMKNVEYGNAQSESKAQAAIFAERSKELAMSRKSRDYEAGRRELYRKEKANWVKRGRDTSELKHIEA